MKQLTTPDAVSLTKIADDIGVEETEYREFMADLWSVLTLKLQGPGANLVTGIVERNVEKEDQWMRAGLAWSDLQKESAGRTTDR